MDKKEDGGRAFAAGGSEGSWQFGMTLRQWYAGMVLPGLFSAPPEFMKAVAEQVKEGDSGDLYAQVAFELADAMIKEGAK